MYSKSLSLLFFCFLYTISLSGQTKISGTIKDEASKEPLPYVNIYGQNTGEGVSSAIDGSYELTTSDSILTISFVGYKTINFKIDPQLKEFKKDFILKEHTTGINYIHLTASRKNYKIPPSVSYLKPRDIQLNNETSIAPSLNIIPGVFMHSGALNTNRITIRGIGNRNLFGTAKIKAYLGGIPLTNGSGETSLEDYDLGLKEGATVYKGPASSIYGAGLGGMISLQVPDDLDRDGISFSLKNAAGSYGLARNVLDFAINQKDKSFININANRTHNDGYRENNEYDRAGFGAYGKFQINEKQSVRMLFNYSFLRAEIPSSLDSTDYVDEPEQAAFIWRLANGYEKSEKLLAGISYEAAIGKHFNQITSVFGNVLTAFERRPFNILRENSIIIGGRSEWIYDYKDFDRFFTNFEFHIGGEVFDEEYNWQTYDTDGEGSRDTLLSDNKELRYYSNVFTQIKLDIDYFISLSLGLNRNYTSYVFTDYYKQDGNQGSFKVFPRTWSPYFNLGLDLERWVGRELALSTTISHGFSPPTLEETLQPDGAINRDIRPEKGWNYEVGVKGSTNNSNFTYGLTFYSMQIKDLLVAKRVFFDQFEGINAGRTSHKGIEVALAYEFNVESMQFKPFINYTYSDYTFKEFIDEEEDHSGNQLTGTSPHLLNGGVHWSNQKFYGNLIYRFVDAMPMRDDNSIFSDAYQLVNLKVGYKRVFEKNGMLIFLSGLIMSLMKNMLR